MGAQTVDTFVHNVRLILNETVSDNLTPTVGTTYLNSDILTAINKAKNRCCTIIRRTRKNYFLVTGAQLAVVTGTKEYQLAQYFKQLRGLKCTTSGWEYLEFREVEMDSVEFQERDALPATDTDDFDEMIYTIYGSAPNAYIKFADFPPAVLTFTYDYVQAVPDITLVQGATFPIDDDCNEYIENYAALVMLKAAPGDPRYKEIQSLIPELKEDVVENSSSRQIRDAEYVEEYEPDA